MMTRNTKRYSLIYDSLIIVMLTFLTGCASNAPFPKEKIQTQSIAILDRLENECITKGESSCSISEKLTIDTCESDTSKTPFDGEGKGLFLKEVRLRYPVQHETQYRDEYNGFINEYLVGEGRYSLTMTRYFRHKEQFLCDDTKISVVYEFKMVSQNIISSAGDLEAGWYKKVNLNSIKRNPSENSTIRHYYAYTNKSPLDIPTEDFIESQSAILDKNAGYAQSTYSKKKRKMEAIQRERHLNEQKNRDRLAQELAASITKASIEVANINSNSYLPVQSSVSTSSSNIAYAESVARSNAGKQSNTKTNQSAKLAKQSSDQKPSSVPAFLKNASTSSKKASTNTSKTSSSKKRRSLAVTWKGKNEKNWFSTGPIQKVQSGSSTESKALSYTCGSKYSTKFVEMFGQYRIHECVGRPLKSYDIDVANKYNLPGKFHNW